MSVVAHQDDDLLFQNPDLHHDIRSGTCVRTVYVTAGDANHGPAYWQSREAGVRAAYAAMAGSANSWTQTDAGVPQHAIPVFTLTARPTVSLVFLRLPDGFPDGSGGTLNGFQSLQKLWNGTISTISPVDESASFTRQDLISTLTALMTTASADRIYAMDYVGSFGDGDHSDHHASAYFAQAASRQFTATHVLRGYQGYGVSERPENVTGADYNSKRDAYLAYAPHDATSCQTEPACSSTVTGSWWRRQYQVGSDQSGGDPQPNQSPVARAGTDQSVTGGASVRLDGSASSDPDGDSLTYRWAQTAGPDVTLSDATAARPTFPAPAGPATLTFQLVVSDGQASSSPATVTVTVAASLPDSANVAGSATVAASSENGSTEQTARKAIDGAASGWPGDYTREWATDGGRAGSWLQLSWPRAYTLDHIVLYDRPNGSDQITAATVQFSDGSTVTTAALANDGSAVTASFPARSTTSVRVTITSVSASTQNVGLSEIEAYGS